jgi:hypothetical protein
MGSGKNLEIYEQTAQLAQQAGASAQDRSITNHVTPPNSEGDQNRISVTSDLGAESVDIQVIPVSSENPLSRPAVHITSVDSPQTRGFAGTVNTTAGEYSTASNQDAQSASVNREGYGTVKFKNPKATELIASLAVKKAGQAVSEVVPAKSESKPGFFKRVLTRS